MQTTTTIGLEIAKSVFQVHGIDADGNVVVRRQLKRRYVLTFFQKLPPCLVGIEACASSHYWSRELQALGHTVRLMPPVYVKPYVKRLKNDAADAEAICEAVTRRNMRFVPTKTAKQQSCLTLHRTRHLFIRQQTAIINSIRVHLGGFGIVAPVGRRGVEQLLKVVADANDTRLPEIARACVAALGTQLLALKAQILASDRRIMAWHRSNETIKRLDAIPCRPGTCNCAGGEHWGSQGVSIGTGFLGLDWTRPEAELERGQGQARQHQQARRSLSAQLVHRRCARRDPLCEAPRHRTSTMACGIAGASANQGRCHRARQKDRANGLGDDDQGALEGTRRTSGVKRSRRASGVM
jgi:hypothetical protein